MEFLPRRARPRHSHSLSLAHADQYVVTVAVFRTGVRGARLVPRASRGPQNLFDLYRNTKPKMNFRHWVGRGGLKAILLLCPHTDKIRHCVVSNCNDCSILV
ncbi:hypothetical protein AVEN_229937-1 [Araneus ventricosus]|uniref:Uncharacterized protein n=1 Tax=Araneus ventricosus TaxID=182803 RepID=A0A4Y2BWC3_ARAVE|nr:hypothetical protein AVEN_229937-1 [Araneus ventricosus]